MRNTILSRWTDDYLSRAAYIPALKNVMTSSFEAADKIRSKEREIRANKAFSASGQTDKLREFLGAEPAATIWRGLRTVETTRTRLAAQEKRLAAPPIDRKDIVAEHRRAEVRTFLRGLPMGDRVALLVGDDADPEFVAAAADMPIALTGVTPQLRGQMLERYAQRYHGRELAVIADAREVLSLVESAINTEALPALARAGGFESGRQVHAWLDSAVASRADTIRRAIDGDLASLAA